MDKLLEYIGQEPVTVKRLLDNPALCDTPYNAASSYLHECHKKGLLLRSKDNNNEWQFALPGAAEQVAPPDDGGLPLWARKPEWSPDRGPYPDVWAGKKAECCWWSCRWVGGEGVGEPRFALETLAPEAKFWEAQDNALRGNAECAIALVGKSPENFEIDLGILKRARESYQEFCGLWYLENVRFPVQRKHWNHVFQPQQHLQRLNDGAWFLAEPGKPDIILSGPKKAVGISTTEQRIAQQSVRKSKILSMGGRTTPQLIDNERR